MKVNLFTSVKKSYLSLIDETKPLIHRSLLAAIMLMKPLICYTNLTPISNPRCKTIKNRICFNSSLFPQEGVSINGNNEN